MSLEGKAAGKRLKGRINSVDTLILSAYAVAVKNGFEGTEEEWLASLKGEKGDKGEKGNKGDKGDTGTLEAHSGINALNHRVVNVASPEADTDATNKQYVDKALEGKAPAGYGLGGDSTLTVTTLADLDLVTANGTYQFTNSAATLYGINCRWAILRVTNYDSAAVMQELFPTGSTTRLVRVRNSNVWGEWEVDNPPMILGVEYRTTERWNGQPVYTVLINCGILPSTGATTTTAIPSPIYGTIDKIIRCGGTTSEGNLIPFTWDGEYMIIASASRSSIFIYSRVENGSNTATIQLWYTKW